MTSSRERDPPHDWRLKSRRQRHRAGQPSDCVRSLGSRTRGPFVSGTDWRSRNIESYGWPATFTGMELSVVDPLPSSPL